MSELKTAQSYLAEVMPSINEISPQQLADKLALASNSAEIAQPIIIDVRELDEYQAGAIENAKHIPRGVLEMQIHQYLSDEGRLSADQDIYLYCRSGGRSALAALSLQNMGFTQVYSLAGGFTRYLKVSSTN